MGQLQDQQRMLVSAMDQLKRWKDKQKDRNRPPANNKTIDEMVKYYEARVKELKKAIAETKEKIELINSGR